MDKVTLTANGGKQEFIGKAVASLRDERNVTEKGQTFREVCLHVLFQVQDNSFLLYSEKRTLGCLYERTLHSVGSLNAIYELLPECWADCLVGGFLDQVSKT